jgi:hypothetical protein
MISCGNTEPAVLVQVNSVKQSGNFYSAPLLRVVIKGEKSPCVCAACDSCETLRMRQWEQCVNNRCVRREPIAWPQIHQTSRRPISLFREELSVPSALMKPHNLHANIIVRFTQITSETLTDRLEELASDWDISFVVSVMGLTLRENCPVCVGC